MDDTFYLTGDEMFLEAMLDASGELGPMTENGWNIYRVSNKDSKGDTASTGLRADLQLKIDRVHKDRLFATITTNRTVFCVLHAVARCVEKLLNLEIQNVLSEGNKEAQRGGDGEGLKNDALYNLEANVNSIRQGNFKTLFDKNGTPEPVSLNKDHALAIISPASQDFPHVLSKVMCNRKLVVQLSEKVRSTLDFASSYTEFEMAVQIWEHFLSDGSSSFERSAST